MPVYTFQLAAHLAGRAVSVTAAGSSATVASGTLDGDAKFTATLPVGDYIGTAGVGYYRHSSAGVVDLGDRDGLLTEAVANSTFAGVAKIDNGGAFLKPVRVPTLNVIETMPDRSRTLRPVWVENNGATIYYVGLDNSVYKSTDAGATFTYKGNCNIGLAPKDVFLKTQAGTLLSLSLTTPPSIMRSTDDGATWVAGQAWRANTNPLGAQSWCQDLNTGYLYYVEYITPANTAAVNVYRSTDDGVTWTVFKSWRGGGDASPEIHHIHSCQYDAVSKRVYFLVGDNLPAAGIYRVNAGGTDVEPVVLNSQLQAQMGVLDAARGIGLMWFPDYIAWACDSNTHPYLMRMARSQIGQANPVAEKIYRLNSTGFFSCKASADGSRWVFSASSESALGANLDGSIHLYAVEDQGATVYEVASHYTKNPSQLSALHPVGQAEIHGATFWLGYHGTTSISDYSYYNCTLSRGTNGLMPAPRLANVYAWETQNSGYQVLAPSQTVIFGHTRAASTNRTLYIFDAGANKKVGTGSPYIKVRKASDGTTLANIDYWYFRARQNLKQEGAPYIAKVTLNSDEAVEFVIYNASGANSVEATAYVTYGWGPA